MLIDRVAFYSFSQRPDRDHQILVGKPARQSQDCDATVVSGIEAERITKVEIEGYEAPILLAANLNDFHIRGLIEILIESRGDIVAGRGQQVRSSTTEVLVKLKPHARSADGIST